MAAIHSLSESLEGVLEELSERMTQLQQQSDALEEKTKEIDEVRGRVEGLEEENSLLKERVTMLEDQLQEKEASQLKDHVEKNQEEVTSRLEDLERRLLEHSHPKEFSRLETCEKKLASFYGEDTNILGRVAHLETVFRDFKDQEDEKMRRQREGLQSCEELSEGLKERVLSLEEGASRLAQQAEQLDNFKLNEADISALLESFRQEKDLLSGDSIKGVTETADDCVKKIDALSRLGEDRDSDLQASLEGMKGDIAELQLRTEPAHHYQCFGTDQSMRIMELENKLKALEGLNSSAVNDRFDRMDGKLNSTASQMDRVLNVENFISSNFDRIGTDYVNLSKMISDIKEEVGSHDKKLDDIARDATRRDFPSGSYPAQGVDTSHLDEKISNLIREIGAVEEKVKAADQQVAALNRDYKDDLEYMQANHDKKVELLASWVAKNINLLAASTRKKLKQLMGNEDMAAFQNNKHGHCLSCNRSKFSGTTPVSAHSPNRQRPIFKVAHLDTTIPNEPDANSSEGPVFRMTVPSSLRTKVFKYRRDNDNDDDYNDEDDNNNPNNWNSGHPSDIDDSLNGDDHQRQREDYHGAGGYHNSSRTVPARPSSAHTALPRKFSRKGKRPSTRR